MQAKDFAAAIKQLQMGRSATNATEKPEKPETKPETIAPESPTGIGVDVEPTAKDRLVESLPNSLAQEQVPQSQTQAPGITKRPATMMEVIGWELTQALYRAHKLGVLPPTKKQVKNNKWPKGQHEKFLIETAKLLTSLLVIVGEEAQQKAQELMNEQHKQGTSGESPKRIVTGQEGNSDSNKGPVVLEGPRPSKIIIPEGFGH